MVLTIYIVITTTIAAVKRRRKTEIVVNKNEIEVIKTEQSPQCSAIAELGVV